MSNMLVVKQKFPSFDYCLKNHIINQNWLVCHIRGKGTHVPCKKSICYESFTYIWSGSEKTQSGIRALNAEGIISYVKSMQYDNAVVLNIQS